MSTRILPIDQVLDRTGLSRRTLYTISEGRFPKPVQLTTPPDHLAIKSRVAPAPSGGCKMIRGRVRSTARHHADHGADGSVDRRADDAAN
jgi:Prophage CP4-57 regulatory protein (AlpA)